MLQSMRLKRIGHDLVTEQQIQSSYLIAMEEANILENVRCKQKKSWVFDNIHKPSYQLSYPLLDFSLIEIKKFISSCLNHIQPKSPNYSYICMYVNIFCIAIKHIKVFYNYNILYQPGFGAPDTSIQTLLIKLTSMTLQKVNFTLCLQSFKYITLCWTL